MHGLQTAFSSGEISPFVLNEGGSTLLHYAAQSFNADLCSWLLGLGVDPDRMTVLGLKALHRASRADHITSESKGPLFSKAVETVRILAQAQEEVSATDVIKCVRVYEGSPQSVELILSQQCEFDDDLSQGIASSSAHVFAAALRNYGQGVKGWETLIRKLIRKGVDIHGRVNCCLIMIAPRPSNCKRRWLYGTPLDELLKFSDPGSSPSPKELGDAWLQILSSEGFNVQAYLVEEAAIHAAQHQLTWPAFNNRGVCRQLCFEMGETPSVWWEWCPDPMSLISLLQVEYKQISFDLPEWATGIEYPVPWQDRWPFDHRGWSDDARLWQRLYSNQDSHGITQYYDWKRTPEWGEIDRLAKERADRRFAKKVRKAMRAQGPRIRSRMPGSWPE